MQSQIQVHETVQETVEELSCQREGSAEHIVKNGPESCSSFEEDQKEEIEVSVCSVVIFLNFSLLAP
jgi:DNA-binding ferritin-like protein